MFCCDGSSILAGEETHPRLPTAKAHWPAGIRQPGSTWIRSYVERELADRLMPLLGSRVCSLGDILLTRAPGDIRWAGLLQLAGKHLSSASMAGEASRYGPSV